MVKQENTKKNRQMRMEATFSNVLLMLLILAAINYLFQIYNQRFKPQLIAPGMYPQREGLTSSNQREGFTDMKESTIYKTNDDLYDDFYASVYDQLTQQATRTAAKVAVTLQEWQKKGWTVEQMNVLDAGCGTGAAIAALNKMKVKDILAVDKSEAMLKKAKENNRNSSNVIYRQADLMNPSALSGGNVSHALCYYFTLYYLPDKEAFFRNLYLWVKPGGEIAIEVVNKYKFDPMLDSAAPWVGFSLQKYSKKRVTESNVAFDKFNYSAKFDLFDPAAEFRETFQFKDGTTRRQKHTLQMPTIEQVVKDAQAAGWTYTKSVDLVSIGFEYSYLLFFRHP